MKILIIGVKGMLGQYLAEVFQDEELTLWDKENLDITNEQHVQASISNLQPQIIINAAAYNDVDAAEKDSTLADKINGTAVGYLATAAKAVGAVLVHYSTDYVFAGENVRGYNETAEPGPVSKYGASKLLGEQELQKNCDQYYLIRLSKLFGKLGAGEGVKKSFVDKILELAETKDELEIIDEDLSSPTYALDLAKRTKEIIDGQMPFGIYHAANAGGCTWYGLAQEVFKLKNIDKKLIPVPASKFLRLAKRPPYSVLLNTKLPPARSWQEALADYLK